MQFVAGKTWERLILENGKLDWPTSARIGCDVLRALEYAHGRGIIHRDMKPSNVLVRDLDGSATVMDFGIAKMTTSTKLTATGQTMGTVRYMSPEQVRGQEVDLRTDLYSLGATLYESLTGDTPFDGSTHFEIMTKHLSEPPKRPSSLGVTVPASIEDAIMRSLSKRADDRFAAAREMRKILEAALREGDVGLVETQKVSRDLLSDVRRSTTTRPPPSAPVADSGAGATAPSRPPRTATAADVSKGLADRLEGDSGKLAARPRRTALWIALAGMVAAGGAATAFLLTRHRGGATSDAGPAEVKGPEIPGVTLIAAKPFPDVHLALAATAGGVSPREIAESYGRALERLRAFAKSRQPGLTIDYPVDNIIAVAQNILCEPTLYLNNATPAKCSSISAAIADALMSKRTLLVVGVPERLDGAMQQGVADAVCTFQQVEGDEAAKSKRINEICAMTTEFATKGHP
jgi:hypothetical protein